MLFLGLLLMERAADVVEPSGGCFITTKDYYEMTIMLTLSIHPKLAGYQRVTSDWSFMSARDGLDSYDQSGQATYLTNTNARVGKTCMRSDCCTVMTV